MSASPTVLRASVGVVGDAEVGKSALLKAFEQKNFFQHSYLMTQHAQLYVQSVALKAPPPPASAHSASAAPPAAPTKVELFLTEVGGHPAFSVSRSKYLTDCPYVLACFDVTRRPSFLSVSSHLSAYRTSLAVPFEFGLLIACKADRRADAEVTAEEAQAKADELGLSFIEVSAANGDGVEKAFERVARQVSERYEKLRERLEEETAGQQQQQQAPVQVGREVMVDDDDDD